MKRIIAIVAGGDTSEYEVSLRSAQGIYSFIDKEKYTTYIVQMHGTDWHVQLPDGDKVPVDRNDFSFCMPDGRKVTFDFAYITIHGTPGEDGRLQGYFDSKALLPLWALESQDPVKDFDMIAFTIGYEMAYSNVLNMLNLAGVPLRAKDRKDLKNMVFAGGVCTFNPEPLAEFVDFFSLGEGEEITVEIVSLYDQAKAEGWDKDRFLHAVAKIPGVYVPSFYRHEYNADGTLSTIVPLEGAPETITKRIVEDLDKAYFPTKMIVPSTEIVHDRANLEAFRGCIRGCRFCQAGFSCRPVRKKSPQVLYRQAVETLEFSGNQEITVSSLSTSDYRGLKKLSLQITTERVLGLSGAEGRTRTGT